MPGIEKRVIEAVLQILRGQHLPRIIEAVDLLSEDEIWEREGSVSNSIGNLLLHLAGNVRQHVVSGLGGEPDTRDRPSEFAARGGASKAELRERLERAVGDAAAVLERLPDGALLERRTIQGKDVLVLDDLLHVAEHFAYHAGQIIYRVKALRQRPFPWYRHLDPPPA